MKKSVFMIGLMALALGGCKDDASDCLTCLPDINGKEFSSSELEVYYMGEQMPAKQAHVSVDKIKEEATMTFSSMLDLSSIPGAGLTGKLQGPGITPGQTTLTLTSPVKASDGAYVFSGIGSTETLTFNYAGRIEEGKMTVYLTDCLLRNQSAVGVYSPAPIEKDGLSYTSLPLHLVWEVDPAAGLEIPLSDILKLLVTAPVIPVYSGTAYMSLAQGFESVVKTIAFTPTGNVPVMYISTLGGAAHLATTSGNMIQYTPASGGVTLYLNPMSVFGEFLLATSNNKNDEKFDFKAMLSKATETDAGESTESEKMTMALLSVLIKTLAPQIAGGVPLTVTPTAKGVDAYFDTRTSVTFLANLMENALQDPTIMAELMKYLGTAQLPEGVTPAGIQTLITDIAGYMQKTTRLEIGLSLVKYQAQ